MLPASPCPLRNADVAKTSRTYLGSNTSARLHTSHIASGHAARSTSVCDKVFLDRTAYSRDLNTRTSICLMCSGGPMSPTGSYVAVQTTSHLVSPTGTNFISALKELYRGSPSNTVVLKVLLASSILSMRSFISPTDNSAVAGVTHLNQIKLQKFFTWKNNWIIKNPYPNSLLHW